MPAAGIELPTPRHLAIIAPTRSTARAVAARGTRWAAAILKTDDSATWRQWAAAAQTDVIRLDRGRERIQYRLMGQNNSAKFNGELCGASFRFGYFIREMDGPVKWRVFHHYAWAFHCDFLHAIALCTGQRQFLNWTRGSCLNYSRITRWSRNSRATWLICLILFFDWVNFYLFV